MNIYPAIDLKAGQVVRLEQGRADRVKVYFEDPQAPAEQWRHAGAEWLHVVDLDGAFQGEPLNRAVVEKLAQSGLCVQLGGGLRTLGAIEAALASGVSRVVVGTRAAESLEFVREAVERFGDRLAVGIDARDGKVAVRGWVDVLERSALDLAREVEDLGVQYVIYTDISRDGMLVGPNFEAQQEILEKTRLNLIASGGVSSLSDIERFSEMAESFSNLDGVITGKALYEGRLDLREAVKLTQRG